MATSSFGSIARVDPAERVDRLGRHPVFLGDPFEPDHRVGRGWVLRRHREGIRGRAPVARRGRLDFYPTSAAKDSGEAPRILGRGETGVNVSRRIGRMEIESGNASDVETRGTGWFVGYGDWTRDGGFDLRHVPEGMASRGLCLKWVDHPAGDPRGLAKPPSTGRTVSILDERLGAVPPGVPPTTRDSPAGGQSSMSSRGRGDFVAWGGGLHHRWFVDEDCTVVTLRWVPDPEEAPR